MPRSLADRFWGKVSVGPLPHWCWGWEGSIDSFGYGTLFAAAGKAPVKAHRVSYRINIGQIPAGRWILHTCDNPPCTNPAHLVVGDRDLNTRHKIERGRSVYGEGCPWCTISSASVAEIRRLYKRRNVTQRDMATSYGISQSHVCRIVNNKARERG